MTSTIDVNLRAAFERVDEDAYTRKHDGSLIPQTSSRWIIEDMLGRLDVQPGSCVLEIGTGSGYSTALLSELTGDLGHVVSIDVDLALTVRAAQLLERHGRTNVTLLTGDGAKGAPGTARSFDRVIAWATVERIPRDWAAQAAAGAVIVAPVELTSLAKTRAIVRAHLTPDGVPVADELLPGGFVEACDHVLDQWLVPPRRVDALIADARSRPWWLSAEWLRRSFEDSAGRTLLHQLIASGRPGPGPLRPGESGKDFCLYLTARRPPELTTAALGEPLWRIGCTIPNSAALIAVDHGEEAFLVGSRAAFDILSRWADQWRERGKPGYTQLRPEVTPDDHGWLVRTAPANTPALDGLTEDERRSLRRRKGRQQATDPEAQP